MGFYIFMKVPSSAENKKMISGVVKKCLDVLSKHMDSVQIMGTWVNEHDETEIISYGTGNWYARQGMATELVNTDSAETLADVLNDNDIDLDKK